MASVEVFLWLLSQDFIEIIFLFGFILPEGWMLRSQLQVFLGPVGFVACLLLLPLSWLELKSSSFLRLSSVEITFDDLLAIEAMGSMISARWLLRCTFMPLLPETTGRVLGVPSSATFLWSLINMYIGGTAAEL